MEDTIDETFTEEQLASTVMASAVEPSGYQPRDLEGGEDVSEHGEPSAAEEGGDVAEVSERSAVPEAAAATNVDATAVGSRETSQIKVSAAHLDDVEGVTSPVPSEVVPAYALKNVSPSQDTMQDVDTVIGDQLQDDEVASCDGNESVTGVCGSVDESEQLEAADESFQLEDDEDIEETIEHEESVVDGDQVTVASVCGSMIMDDHDECVNDIQSEREMNIEADVQQVKQTGKRTHRDETKSEESRVEQTADKQKPKRTRTGLREYHERRRPRYLDYYEVNVMQRSERILDKDGKPILARNAKIPRNRREVNRSKYRKFWLQSELEEMSALRAKGVIMEIPCEDVPRDAKPINTRWVRSLKSDRQGYVTRFKSRIVALGNYQRPGIDFAETFAPVARMSSFRMIVALAAVLHLLLCGGDINTAYLNALLKIRQYLKSIDGFPCEINGHVYVVLRALYGLRQSGREWNTELNNWFLAHGYLRSLTEPCLYYKVDGGTIMLVLVYVDDIIVATNNETDKCNMFKELDEAYGIKDQGLLKDYLGIEVEQTEDSVTIRQTKYAREILETFGYENDHAVGNPMETNVRLVPLDAGERSDTSFEYRKAIGMLMYLATGTRPDLAFAVGRAT
jgi:hypothetical protein